MLVVVAAAAGCGGGAKHSGTQSTRTSTQKTLSASQYVTILNQLCSSANTRVAALRLTTAMNTWKRHGRQAAEIAQDTIKGFAELTPPDELKRDAAAYVRATREIGAAVTDAADAARSGNVKQFDDAISRQQNAGSSARSAAGRMGADQCS
jgi:hypothetical protein